MAVDDRPLNLGKFLDQEHGGFKEINITPADVELKRNHQQFRKRNSNRSSDFAGKRGGNYRLGV